MSLACVESFFREAVVIYRHSDTGPLKIKESDPGALLKKLTVSGVPANSVAVELDHSPSGDLKRRLGKAFCQLSPLIKEDHSLANKKCDFVIFYELNDSYGIVLGDLKSVAPKKSECRAQLDNSELFVRYVLAMLEKYAGLAKNFTVSKVVVHLGGKMMIKAPANQKNKSLSLVVDGVRYLPVVPLGRNNSEVSLPFGEFV